MKIPTFVRFESERTFVCREAYSESELKALFRLRYAVYRDTFDDFLVPANAAALDVDGYDLRSIHIGVFEYKGDRHRAVGYLRLITEAETLAAAAVRHIATEYGLCEQLEPSPFLLPMFKYFGERDAAAMVADWQAMHGCLFETSRFCLHPTLQHGATARFAVRSMMDLALDYFGTEGVVLIIVAPHHTRFYEQYGFRAVAQLLPSVAHVPQAFVVLNITMKQVFEREANQKSTARSAALGLRQYAENAA